MLIGHGSTIKLDQLWGSVCGSRKNGLDDLLLGTMKHQMAYMALWSERCEITFKQRMKQEAEYQGRSRNPQQRAEWSGRDLEALQAGEMKKPRPGRNFTK